MKLPPLGLIVSTQFILWCIAGVWVHGWSILLYPVFWSVVILSFACHYRFVACRRRTATGWSKPAGSRDASQNDWDQASGETLAYESATAQ